MQTSSDRMLTTHVGSLPRSKGVTDGVFGIESGEPVDIEQHEELVAAEVGRVVARQVEAGIDVVSDGEMSKISYATYIRHRLTGFSGDSPRRAPQDLEAFPSFMERLATSGGTPQYSRPKCVGPIEVKTMEPLHTDLVNLRVAVDQSEPVEAFMNAASPGVIALFQPNEYYPDHEAYLFALAEAMRAEYEGIVAAGFILQIDSPDIGLGRHMMFKDKADDEYEKLARLHIDALNHAVANIPPEKMRFHVCWGNYEGPHIFDVGMDVVLPIALEARPQALLFESSNPRHAHEWEVFAATDIPEDKILVPGVIDSTTNFVEHPRLISQRLRRFADIVGRERVIAGTDCGFSTFAGFGAVDPDITYAKLAALAQGAALASEELW